MNNHTVVFCEKVWLIWWKIAYGKHSEVIRRGLLVEKPVESVHNRMYTVVIIVACGFVKNEM